MALATLSIDLIAKIAQFEADLGKAARASERFAASTDASMKFVTSAIKSMVGAFSVGLIVAWGKSIIDASDNLRDMAQAAGTSVEVLGGLGFAASQAGGSLEGIAGASKKLNKALADAAAGNKEAIEAFDALGISAVDASGKTKSVDKALVEIADRFSTAPDGPEKLAVSLRLLGKSGEEQISLLNEGGAALQANIEYYKRFSGVTTELAGKSDEFNDALGKINLIAQSLGNTIIATLLPTFQALADSFLKAKEEGGAFEVVAKAIKFALDSVVLVAASASYAFKVAGIEIGGFFAKLAAIGEGSKMRSTISDAVAEDLRKAKLEFKTFGQQVLGIGASSPNDQSEAEARRLGLSKLARTSVIPRLPSSGGGKDPKVKEYEAVNKELQSFLAGLEKEAEKQQELTTLETARLRISESTALGFSEALRDRILLLAENIDKEKALVAAQEERIKAGRAFAIEQGVDNSEYQARLKSLLDATPEAKLTAIREDVRLLAEEFDAGRISQESYVEAIKARIESVGDSLVKTKTLGEELGLTFSSAFEDAIVGGKNLGEILKGLEQDIIRIVTRKAITEPLGNAIGGIFNVGGSGGGLGGFLGNIFTNLFSADGGGFTGSGSRSGGLDGRGGFLGMLHPNETVLDHTRGQSMGGNVISITVNQSFAAGTSRATTLQAAADARRQLELGGRNL